MTSILFRGLICNSLVLQHKLTASPNHIRPMSLVMRAITRSMERAFPSRVSFRKVLDQLHFLSMRHSQVFILSPRSAAR